MRELASQADLFGEKIKLIGESVAKLLHDTALMKLKLNEVEIDLEGRMDWKQAKEEFRKKKQKIQAHVREGVRLGV